MKNIYPKPEDDAILIAVTEVEGRRLETWATMPSAYYQEVYVWSVDNDQEGSFATWTMCWAVGELPMRRHSNEETAYVALSKTRGAYSLYVTPQNHYLGHGSIVAEWIARQMGFEHPWPMIRKDSEFARQLRCQALVDDIRLRMRKEGTLPPTRGRYYTDPDGVLDYEYTNVGWTARGLGDYPPIGIAEFKAETGHVPGRR